MYKNTLELIEKMRDADENGIPICLGTMYEIIANTPDAITLCKDCANRYYHHCSKHNCQVEADDFCSFAEKKRANTKRLVTDEVINEFVKSLCEYYGASGTYRLDEIDKIWKGDYNDRSGNDKQNPYGSQGKEKCN